MFFIPLHRMIPDQVRDKPFSAKRGPLCRIRTVEAAGNEAADAAPSSPVVTAFDPGKA
jgi:hypothetical protein